MKRPASTLKMCNRCGRKPIAQCRFSDLAVCWSCDQYLWWLNQSRAAQKFLDEFHASETGNRPLQLPSATQRITSAVDVQSSPRHSASAAERLSNVGGSDCSNIAREECVCGFPNAQSCPSKENHHCRMSSAGCQHACATLISEVSRALTTISHCSKRLKTACAAFDSSDVC